jgi:hypothetical protein
MYRPISILASRDRSASIWQPSHRHRLEPVASAAPERRRRWQIEREGRSHSRCLVAALFAAENSQAGTHLGGECAFGFPLHSPPIQNVCLIEV